MHNYIDFKVRNIHYASTYTYYRTRKFSYKYITVCPRHLYKID